MERSRRSRRSELLQFICRGAAADGQTCAEPSSALCAASWHSCAPFFAVAWPLCGLPGHSLRYSGFHVGQSRGSPRRWLRQAAGLRPSVVSKCCPRKIAWNDFTPRLARLKPPLQSNHAVGRVKRKVEPWASSLSARMVPWWANTMCLAMARPRPVPPDSRERALSTR